jgi:alpha-galactosidase
MKNMRVTDDFLKAYSDFQFTENPKPDVRYTSDQVIYRESLLDGHWQGRFWSADGRINVPYESWGEDAFILRVDDNILDKGWEWVSTFEAQKPQRGGHHFVIELLDVGKGIRVKVHTLLDGTPVLTRWLEITNEGKNPVGLYDVLPWSGRLWPGKNFTMGYFASDLWAKEGWFKWKPLKPGTTRLECNKGQGFDDPFFIVRNEINGEYFIGHLAWSANWVINFHQDAEGLCFNTGPKAYDAQRVVDPGETVTTPSVHLGHVSGSLDDAVQAMHDHLRKSVIPQRQPDRFGLIQYLVPADQGYYKPFNEESARKCVDVAHAIGAELFLLDAYWWDITPDYYPSTERFPNGLKPIIEYARSKGMLFGLYLENEAGRGKIKESKVFKEHPEWFGPHNVLKVGDPEAAAWMEADIRRILDEYRLDLYREDYNPLYTYEGPATERHGFTENNYWRYYETLYGMYERIGRDYPKLILQQCAAGGARNDLGLASRFHETYLTDGLSLPREWQIYSGLSLGLPPEVFVILHGADGGQGMGKQQNIDTILRLSFALSTPQIFVGMVAPSVEELSPYRKARFLHYGKIYKDFIRPLLPTCKVFHHEPINCRQGVEESPWFVMEYAAPDRSKAWAVASRMSNGPGDDYHFKYSSEQTVGNEMAEIKFDSSSTYRFTPLGIDAARNYKVTFDSLDTTVTINGMQLLQTGIPLHLENAGMSELLLFEAV